MLTRVSDPVIQDLLDKAWRPYWDKYRDADLARSNESIPGLELARKRRAELVAITKRGKQ